MNKKYICVIDAANIDVCGTPFDELRAGDSNPGVAHTTLGGVGRNIAENLTRMGVNTELITALGDDHYADKIKDNCNEIGISIKHSLNLENTNTSTYVYVLDHKSDLYIAVSDMEIYNNLTIDFIKSRMDVINNAEVCIIGTNLPKETIRYIIKNSETPIFVDTVSVKKSMRIKNNLEGINTIKANAMEAEFLTDIEINTTEDAKKASLKLLDQGIENVFISMGAKGLHYRNKNKNGFIAPYDCKAVNTSGAGDSMMASIAMTSSEDFEINDTAKVAVATSSITIESDETVSKKMTREEIEKRANFKI